jgi:hypothetical protein
MQSELGNHQRELAAASPEKQPPAPICPSPCPSDREYLRRSMPLLLPPPPDSAERSLVQITAAGTPQRPVRSSHAPHHPGADSQTGDKRSGEPGCAL